MLKKALAAFLVLACLILLSACGKTVSGTLSLEGDESLSPVAIQQAVEQDIESKSQQ